MFAFHQTLHETYGICLWTILAVAVLVALIVIACIYIFSDSVKRKLFDKKLKENYYIDVFDDEDVQGGKK